jgi:DinB superfamily
MKRSNIKQLPKYFDRYINQVPDFDIIDCFNKFGGDFLRTEQAKFEALGTQVYAVDKWTIRDIIQHLIDTERIFSYRALRFARQDKTPLPGFDENHFADIAKTANRSIEDLISEFEAVRLGTKALFKSLDSSELQNEGNVMANPISVLAMGFTIIGHPIHHLNVIKERYYPLLQS